MKNFGIVGAGYRAFKMFAEPIAKQYNQTARLVGVVDRNIHRCNVLKGIFTYDVPVYTNIDDMLSKKKLDYLIITTLDSQHDYYIKKAIQYGCNIICEKPLTINENKAHDINDLLETSRIKLYVILNSRYMPINQQIYDILSHKEIGEILHINYEWFLDRNHGADYYHRWHRQMKNSGGLLVHKSVHHFDLINWWLNDTPVELQAQGSLMFYGEHSSEFRNYGVRCKKCCQGCSFKYRPDDLSYKLYFEAENDEGYIRDACVFDKEIDIYDTMTTIIQYSKGTIVNYSLITYAPYEGWNISITGKNGRIQGHYDVYKQCGEIVIHKNSMDDVIIEFPSSTLKHAGADQKMQNIIFNVDENQILKLPGRQEAIKSISIGICSNISIKEKRMVRIAEYFPKL